MKIDHTTVNSGTLWRAGHPWCWRLIPQYIEPDRWCLMSEPEKATHGGSNMSPMVSPTTHSLFCTHAEIVERLEKMECVKEEGLELGIVKIIGSQIVGGHVESIFA